MFCYECKKECWVKKESILNLNKMFGFIQLNLPNFSIFHKDECFVDEKEFRDEDIAPRIWSYPKRCLK